jgi:hypothetical protein
MNNHTELAEVLLAGLPHGEREHVVDLISQVTDAELRRLRARDAGKRPEPYPTTQQAGA